MYPVEATQEPANNNGILVRFIEQRETFKNTLLITVYSAEQAAQIEQDRATLESMTREQREQAVAERKFSTVNTPFAVLGGKPEVKPQPVVEPPVTVEPVEVPATKTMTPAEMDAVMQAILF